MRRRKNSKTLYAELDDIEFHLARAHREQEEAVVDQDPGLAEELQYEIDGLFYQKERIESQLAQQGLQRTAYRQAGGKPRMKYRSNPKYRLGQKVAYEHPRIKSQMRGIIDEIDGDIYYVRDFGGFSETMTPVQDEDILGVLDFQGYIIKDKPKRKKFLGLFNNPDHSVYPSPEDRDIFDEMAEERAWDQSPEGRRFMKRSRDEDRRRYFEEEKLLREEAIEDELMGRRGRMPRKRGVTVFHEREYGRYDNPKSDRQKSNPASRHALVHRGLKYAQERDWRNVRDDFDEMAQGGIPIASDGFDVRMEYPEWDDEDFQAVYDVMEAHHYDEKPRYRKNPYGDDY